MQNNKVYIGKTVTFVNCYDKSDNGFGIIDKVLYDDYDSELYYGLEITTSTGEFKTISEDDYFIKIDFDIDEM